MARNLSGKHPLYYEAILQLREYQPEVETFLRKELFKEKNLLSRVVSVKGGKDFYLVDKNSAKNLGKKLNKRFGGEIKITASLWGMKKGKRIYRLTVLFKGINFKIGEAIKYQGEEWVIKALGKDILLQNKKTGEKKHLKYREKNQLKRLLS